MRLGRAAGLTGVLVVAALGCQIMEAVRYPRLPDCPGSLARPEQVPDDFHASGSYRVRRSEHQVALRVVLERRGDRLVLVAFTPVGAEAFSVIQEGDSLEIQAPLSGLLGVSPEDVLRDLHRVHFGAVLGPPPAGVEVERASVDGQPRVRVKSASCGSEASYVADPKPSGAGG